MDNNLGTNDFKNSYEYCKDCVFQNKPHYFNGRCQVYILCKPKKVAENGECEFYTSKSSDK